MKKLLALVLCVLGFQAQSAIVRFAFTNALGNPDTNVFKVQPIGDVIAADGSFITKGVPIAIRPNSSGIAQTNLSQGHYQITNQFLARGFLIRVPQDDGPTVYCATCSTNNGPTGLAISGYNTFVTIEYGTNATTSFNNVTNALGFLPQPAASALSNFATVNTNFYVFKTNGSAVALAVSGGLTSVGTVSSAQQFGGNSTATADYSLAVGTEATASGHDSIAIGALSVASGMSGTALGSDTTAEYFSTAIGSFATASGSNSIALGGGALASAFDAVSLGRSSSATHTNAIALGNHVNTAHANEIRIGTSNHTVRIPGGLEITNATGQTIILTNGAITFGSGEGALTAAGGGAFQANVTVPNEAYNATTWNGSTAVPTKDAIRDKIETLGSGGSSNITDSAYTAVIRNASVQTNLWVTNSLYVFGNQTNSGNLDIGAMVISQDGALFTTEDITASSFSGDLNASQLASGNVPTARYSILGSGDINVTADGTTYLISSSSGGSSNAIANLNGRGTNTSLTNFVYLLGTNVYAANVRAGALYVTNTAQFAGGLSHINAGGVFAYVGALGANHSFLACDPNTTHPSSGSYNVLMGAGSGIGPAVFSTSISGGQQNKAINNNSYGNIGGGIGNSIGSGSAQVNAASITGGAYNTNQGNFSTIVGGFSNRITGDYAFASGRSAYATNNGAFVLSDSQNSIYGSTASDQLSARFQGGIRFTTPELNVSGQITGGTLNISNINFTGGGPLVIDDTLLYLRVQGKITNDDLTASSILAAGANKELKSVSLSGLTFDGTTLTATGGGGGGTVSNSAALTDGLVVVGKGNGLIQTTNSIHTSTNYVGTLVVTNTIEAPNLIVATNLYANTAIITNLEAINQAEFTGGLTVNQGNATIDADGNFETTGTISAGGVITGNGSGLTNLNATELRSGLAAPQRLAPTNSIANGSVLTIEDGTNKWGTASGGGYTNGYTERTEHHATTTLSDNLDLYFGWSDSQVSISAGNYNIVKMPIMKSGTIKRIHLTVLFGTPGSGETVTGYVRINDTTDIGTLTWTMDGTSPTQVIDSSVSHAVTAGDYWAFKVDSPADYVTPALAVRWKASIYIE